MSAPPIHCITGGPVSIRKRIRNFIHDLLVAISGMGDEK